jgi:hypothetical protein
MLGRIAGGFILIILLFAFSSQINNGIANLRTDMVTQSEITVTTGGGVTTKDIVLDRELFGADGSHVTSIASSLPADDPVAGTYVDVTDTLTITGLAESESRDLTIIYLSEKADDFWSAIGPFMGFLIFGGIIAAIIWGVWQGKHAGSYRGG